jgi:hypothetical protein
MRRSFGRLRWQAGSYKGCFCQVGAKPSLPKLYVPLTAADLDLRNLNSSGTYRE